MVDDKKTLSGTITFLTSEAFKYHQKGDLKEAKNIYEQILKHKPTFDAARIKRSGVNRSLTSGKHAFS